VLPRTLRYQELVLEFDAISGDEKGLSETGIVNTDCNERSERVDLIHWRAPVLLLLLLELSFELLTGASPSPGFPMSTLLPVVLPLSSTTDGCAGSSVGVARIGLKWCRKTRFSRKTFFLLSDVVEAVVDGRSVMLSSSLTRGGKGCESLDDVEFAGRIEEDGDESVGGVVMISGIIGSSVILGDFATERRLTIAGCFTIPGCIAIVGFVYLSLTYGPTMLSAMSLRKELAISFVLLRGVVKQ
jgi:hypothetical protein